VTSSTDIADLNGHTFGRTSCPLSFVVIALIFLELRGGRGICPPRRPPPPPPPHPKKTPPPIREENEKVNDTFMEE